MDQPLKILLQLLALRLDLVLGWVQVENRLTGLGGVVG